MSDLDLRTAVSIEAPPEDVWKALTTPAEIKRWFFGVDTETDWKVGSPLVHRGVYQGKPYEDKGAIVEFDPPRTLAHSHWSPASGTPDTPENYQLVRWTLQERDGQTELTVAEDNLPSVEARTASEQGWELALNGLKELLENDEHPG